MASLRLKQGDLQPHILRNDIFYELTDGGYLKPEDYLDEESSRKVKNAIHTIKRFERLLAANDLLEES